MSEIRRTFSLPLGFTATFSWQQGGNMMVEWEPDLKPIPSFRHRRKLQAAYFAARRSFLTEVAAVIDGAILIADTDGRISTVGPPTKQ